MSAWDQNAGVYVLSPVVSVVEDITAGWLKELAGLPAGWSTGFVTGCQAADFTALATARQLQGRTSVVVWALAPHC